MQLVAARTVGVALRSAAFGLLSLSGCCPSEDDSGEGEFESSSSAGGAGTASTTSTTGSTTVTTTSDSTSTGGTSSASTETTASATSGGGSAGTSSGAASGTGGSSSTTGSGDVATTATATSGDPISGDNPAPGEYDERAFLPEANSEMAVAEVNGLIYVVGGYPSSRQTQTTVQVYDPSSDSWDLAAPLPIAIHHPVVVGAEGKLYSMGGQTDDGDTDRTLIYDPESDVWDDASPMPTARGAGAGALIDDKIYVVGGRPPAMNQFEVYDISDDAWSELPPLPLTYNQRNHLAAAAIGGKLYVAGGRYDGGSFSDPMTDSLDVFDPAEGEWILGEPMLRPRGGLNGVAAYGCFHTWGGEGSNIGEPNNVFPDHDVYDPTTDSWTALDPLPTPVHGVTGAVFLDGLIYMPGGGTSQGGSSGSTIFQVYRPAVRCD